jgi:hypothetical protein
MNDANKVFGYGLAEIFRVSQLSADVLEGEKSPLTKIKHVF